MFGFDGATPMAPIDAIGWPSKIGDQVRPALNDFPTPPPTDPKQKVFGCPGPPLTALTRPPRNGPIIRQRSPEYRPGLTFSCAFMTGARVVPVRPAATHGPSTVNRRINMRRAFNISEDSAKTNTSERPRFTAPGRG